MSSAKSLPDGRLFCFGCFALGVTALLFLAASIRPLQATDSPPAPVSFTIGAFTFIRPDHWEWVIPSSAMRKVQLAITSQKDGLTESADVSFFYFGSGQGGSVQANVERWSKQFSSPNGSPVKAATESRIINGISMTFVSARGSYSAGAMDNTSTTQTGFELRGAILESSRGDVFVKITGPEALVKAATPTFDDMIIEACRQGEVK